MAHPTSAVGANDPIEPSLLLEAHRRLLAGTRQSGQSGALRTEPNWIGGSSYNPCSEVYVPPTPELVPGLIEDLCRFCCTDDLRVVAQAAIAHAQFETIHPFADGNGRTVRALIHLILRRRGLAPRVLPPVSLIFATWSKNYIDGLTRCRYFGGATSAQAQDGVNRWTEVFAAPCIRALPGAPVLTVESGAAVIDRTFDPADEAVQRLVNSGIPKQITIGRRNRAFEAPDVIDAFTVLERQLASPAGDTQLSKPRRPVPTRPSGRRETPRHNGAN